MLVVGLLVLVGLGGRVRAADPVEPPNILLITIDDLNTDITGWGGAARTPNIDRLAAAGAKFSDAHCNVPVCNASRASFLTGLATPELGVYSNRENFRSTKAGKKAVTLPQFFAAHGYETVAAGKIFHQGRGERDEPRPSSDPQSWQTQFRNGTGVPTPHEELPKAELWHKGKLGVEHWPGMTFAWYPVDIEDEETDDGENARFAADFLAEKHEKPFFLACGIFRPHAPFTAPRKYFDEYPLDSVKRPPMLEGDLADLPETAVKWAHKADLHKWITHFDQWDRAMQGYYASASFADACVGVVLDALEASPYRDNTIVVLVSDHGFHLGTKEHWAKFTFWDNGTRIPYIIKMPGAEPQVVESTVSLIDLYPTIVELAGFEPPEEVAGRSLAGAVRDGAALAPEPVHQYFQEPGNEAIVTEDWRYIRYDDGGEELYDRQADPNDWQNLAGKADAAETLERLRGELTDWSQVTGGRK